MILHDSNSLVINGVYEHYKGRRYKVLSMAKDSETLEELVVYQALYGDFGTWVRSLKMFQEKVMVQDKLVPRFKLIGKE